MIQPAMGELNDVGCLFLPPLPPLPPPPPLPPDDPLLSLGAWYVRAAGSLGDRGLALVGGSWSVLLSD
jgi:hypothetical protein